MARGALELATERCWTVCHGCCMLTPLGKTCRIDTFTGHLPPSFRKWRKDSVRENILKSRARHLRSVATWDLPECFIDRLFEVAKKAPGGGKDQARQRYDGHGSSRPFCLPIAIHMEPAGPQEVTLVEATLAPWFALEAPRPLIGDWASDSDPSDEKPRIKGIELFAPHRTNRVKSVTQDGRKPRRYRRRWKTERLNAWLQNSRRVLVHHEHIAEKKTLVCFTLLASSFCQVCF